MQVVVNMVPEMKQFCSQGQSTSIHIRSNKMDTNNEYIRSYSLMNNTDYSYRSKYCLLFY